jgi:hypothetical protein
MANQTMLKRHRRQLTDGQQPVGCYWSGHDYVYLYRAADAVDMPPLSPGRQRRYDAARTCAECGTRALHPFERGDDGGRYCQPCQGPVHQRLWDQARAADKPVIAEWARGVLTDPTVILGATRSGQYYREVHVADVAGTVLLDAKVYYSTGVRADPGWLAKLHEQDPDTVSPADLVTEVAALAGRRPVTWWPSTDLRDLAVEFDTDGRPLGGMLGTANGDQFGSWYDRWVGKLAGSTYRYHPSLAHQPPPWEPAEQVARMRTLLAEMAAGRPATEPATEPDSEGPSAASTTGPAQVTS